MKKIINYEKDIQFKTSIGEICTISLEHDFTVDDRTLKGEFIIEGNYKPNALSLNKEAFTYRLPLEYDLENTCDIDTLNYDIDNFEYNVNNDTLEIYIDFGVRYEERSIEPTIPTITEEELNKDFETIDIKEIRGEEDLIQEPKGEPVEKNDKTAPETLTEDEFTIENTNEEELPTRLDEDEQELILDKTYTDEYITYHVHIVREGDTLDTIANKYNTTIDVIKEYNSVESLELKSKLIIPCELDE